MTPFVNSSFIVLCTVRKMVLLSIEIYVLVILVLHLYSSEAAISRHCSAFDCPSKQCASDIEMHRMQSGPVPAYEGRMGQRGRCTNDPPIKKTLGALRHWFQPPI